MFVDVFQFDLTKSKLSYQTNFQYFSKQTSPFTVPSYIKDRSTGSLVSLL